MVDKVRASRDGHEYHEAWTARRALQLLLPQDNLVGIAIEGLAPADQKKATRETVEIADLTLYYGKHYTFKTAERVEVLQFKYSISKAAKEYRASDAKKTIQKFAQARKDFIAKYGVGLVKKKLHFELVTNRPIFPAFASAIEYLAKGRDLKERDVKSQAEQFKNAARLDGDDLLEFAASLKVTGLMDSLRSTKVALSRIIADWSVAQDILSRARLGDLRDLVREKAGGIGENRNIISIVDVLGALDLQHETDILPCPESFPEVGKVVEREQLSEALKLFLKLDKPLLIHAAGGIGKTVFLQSLSKALSKENVVVLFDCFGGGAYRAIEDARHLPQRGLLHIINTLACQGLCDPILPGSSKTEDFFLTVRRRLSQAVETIQRSGDEKRLFILIDAADNAAEAASDKSQDSFPCLLLESFTICGLPHGVNVAMTCRSYKIDIARGSSACYEFPLAPFSLAETQSYLHDRIKDVSQSEVEVAYSRSDGNPRVLEHLVLSDRGLLDPSEINTKIVLDDLLKERIEEALKSALNRGYSKENIDGFLAGLSVLPPPIPILEYAEAHAMQASEVESFVADLAPLLEKNPHGVMFRDEPTESLIRRTYGSNMNALKSVADRLRARQKDSVYAARSLPGLLCQIEDSDALLSLAFDDQFPHQIKSHVGRQVIRYSRLKAALSLAVKNKNYDHLIRLMIELSMVAVVDNRGRKFLIQNPDLVVISNDVDAIRRLFEIRTSWPGKRHACLATAHILNGDFTEGYRHARRADEWIEWFYKQKYRPDRPSPEAEDIASIPLCLISQGKLPRAISYFSRWREGFDYSVAWTLFQRLSQARYITSCQELNLDNLLNKLVKSRIKNRAIYAAVLSIIDINSRPLERNLIKKLASSCKGKKQVEEPFSSRIDNNPISKGLRKAAALAIRHGYTSEALNIISNIPIARPSIWSFEDRLDTGRMAIYIENISLNAAGIGRLPELKDVLPEEIFLLIENRKCNLADKEFKNTLNEIINKEYKRKNNPDERSQRKWSYEMKRTSEEVIHARLEPLLNLSGSLTNILVSSTEQVEGAFKQLLDHWSSSQKDNYHHSYSPTRGTYFDAIGRDLAIFSLRVRKDIGLTAIREFLTVLEKGKYVSPSIWIDIVSIFAQQDHLHNLAGEVACKAASAVDREDDVDLRASLFATLSRAILPASREESTNYFRKGLEQLDAIGSGDYEFTNELLLFASSLKTEELSSEYAHILSNICELNMPYEEEKFPWVAAGNAFSRIGGYKMLAKIGRWEDREKISLNYTLLFYLTALIKDSKLDPESALCLLKLSDPVETWSWNTATFTRAIVETSSPHKEKMLKELIEQIELNNPISPSTPTLKVLCSIVDNVLGTDSVESQRLHAIKVVESITRKEDLERLNVQNNYVTDEQSRKAAAERERKNKETISALIEETYPCNEEEISKSIDVLDGIQGFYTGKSEFLKGIRLKVRYSDRNKYITAIASLNNLGLYTKLGELKTALEAWEGSSASLKTTCLEIAKPLVKYFAIEIIGSTPHSISKLYDIAKLTKTPLVELAMELVAYISTHEYEVHPAMWLCLSSILYECANPESGKVALERLLISDAAKLTSSVVDGEWNESLEPENSADSNVAGLIWLKLGSPYSSDRWRAAHSVRCLANFEKWGILDILVSKIWSKDAEPFQAKELPFYYLHARLWLLIALARLATDYPKFIKKYKDTLEEIAFSVNFPHVVMQYFAGQALARVGELSDKVSERIVSLNRSPFPRLHEKRKTSEGPFYWKRPGNIPEPKPSFTFDYDFEKEDLGSLGDVFGKPAWEVGDYSVQWIRKWVPTARSMYEKGGREDVSWQRARGIDPRYHIYGHYLSWHALFLSAGELLSKCPITEDSYIEEPWPGWLNLHLLTRNDGLWLSDGTDRFPLDVRKRLLERNGNNYRLSGGKDKLLPLLDVEKLLVSKEMVVYGSWTSRDDVKVHISSALVNEKDGKKLAKQLSQEKPFYNFWLPIIEDYGRYGESSRNTKPGFEALIAIQQHEPRLDEYDPNGIRSANERPRLKKDLVEAFKLHPVDSFNRTWNDNSGKIVLRAEAWGLRTGYGKYEKYETSERLFCSSSLLKAILKSKSAELILTVKLQRYEEKMDKPSRFSHSTAVIRCDKNLKLEYYDGFTNLVHTCTF